MTLVPQDLPCEKFGSLVVIGQRSVSFAGRKRTIVDVVCDCGTVKSVGKDWLLGQGDKASCGCGRTESWLNSLMLRISNIQFAFNKLHYEYSRAAKAKNLVYRLTDLELSFCLEPCIYCGDEPSRKISRGGVFSNESVLVTGLDRIDNDCGYVKRNIVSCCIECNKSKSSRSVVDFLNHASRIDVHDQNSIVSHVKNDTRAETEFYRRYIKGANGRDMAFDVTREEFIGVSTKPCYFCGREPKHYKLDWRTNRGIITNGVDRYDNDIGYVLDNMVPCCQECNVAKLTTHGDTFIDKHRKIAQRFPSMLEFYRVLEDFQNR